jgi:hypothetical protein
VEGLCCDARAMNKNLITEPEAVPNMHEIMMHAEGGYTYSTTDLVKIVLGNPHRAEFAPLLCI